MSLGRRAAIIGSGPNGLVAACLLAKAGWEVTVNEGAATAGGGIASAELFGEGLVSDLGASVHPMGPVSEALTSLELESHGLEWVYPEIPAAHCIDNEPPVYLRKDISHTAQELGDDAATWSALMGPVARRWATMARAALNPPMTWGAASGGLLGGVLDSAETLGRLASWLGDDVPALVSLGVRGAWPATMIARIFREDRTKALFHGLAAHSTVPLNQPITGAFGILFAAAAHSTGWPVVKGGSQGLANALISVLEAFGGKVQVNTQITAVQSGSLTRRGSRSGRHGFTVIGAGAGAGAGAGVSQRADVVILDLSPRQMLALDGVNWPKSYARALRGWRYGPGIVKVDYLMDGPIPWADPEMQRVSTVHLGGSARQIQGSEAAVNRGRLPGRPYVLLAQPAAGDDSRTPDERTLSWAYAHVPHGLSGVAVDRAAAMITQEISRYAPGFAASCVQQKVWSPGALERWNPNLHGGVISGGAPSLGQFVARPTLSQPAHTTGVPGMYVCSSSTPPGGGAHGMPGYHAARRILHEMG